MEYKIVKEDVKYYCETEYALQKPGIDDISKMSPPQAKFFQIYGDKTFLRQKIMVPPPGRIKNFQFLPKTYFSPGILKSEFPTQTEP